MSIYSPAFSACFSISFLARMKPPSLPVKPTALPPCWLIRLTISLLTGPPSTISTMSMVSRSVTRMPWTNTPSLPTRFSRSLICGPPPCTITGFMPTSLSSTTSLANPCFRCSSVMALPPYLMTMVLPGSAGCRAAPRKEWRLFLLRWICSVAWLESFVRGDNPPILAQTKKAAQGRLFGPVCGTTEWPISSRWKWPSSAGSNPAPPRCT